MRLVLSWRDSPLDTPGRPATCHDAVVLRPFVAYLRVYEPVSAFGDPPPEQLVKAVVSGQLTWADVGEREQFR